MFGFFKREKKPTVPTLFFKDNAAAFEYACKFCNCNIASGNILVALIEEAKLDKEGRQSALLRIATVEGGKTTVCPAADSVPRLNKGDLAAFQIFDVAPGVKSVFAIQGAVVAKLGPEFSEKGWKIER